MTKSESLWLKEGFPNSSSEFTISSEQASHHRKALAWFLSGWIALFATIPLYAIARFVATTLPAAAPSANGLQEVPQSAVVFQIINISLSLLPIVLIPLGSIIGLVYLLKKK